MTTYVFWHRIELARFKGQHGGYLLWTEISDREWARRVKA